MGMANIDALIAEIAQIKESLRIKNQSLANINPNYQSNQAYIAKLKSEIAVLNSNLATAQASLKADSTPPKLPTPVKKPDPVPVATSEYANYISVITPQGNLLFPDQATFDAWQNDPASVAFSTTPGGQVASIVPPPVESNNTTVDDGSDPFVSNGQTTIEPVNQVNVDDGSDPFVSNGQTTIEPIQAQTNVDDGSDPYVSNGQTTIETVQDQQNVDDGSDPYVSNGQTTIPAPAPGQFSLSESNARALSAAKEALRGQKTSQDQANTAALGDWRVKLSLAPNAEYLYAGPNPGILLPLKQTGGVIFPYTPSISVNYAANYAASDPVHSNYKIYQYTSSSVDNIQISCVFTAQDTADANYLLAVIHFFRSVTKMFYGQDQNPINGTPPPLCYLTGMGSFQFDRHPLAITSFNYSLPTDVDYIQTGNAASLAGVNRQQTGNDAVTRYNQSLIDVGGNPPPPAWRNTPTGAVEPTYVPTKISLSISAVPVVSRNDISNRFSLNEYGAGNLLRGSQNNGAGIW